MEILQFKKVTQDVEKLPFDCGVDSINEYVKNSYYPTITQYAYAYSIYYKNIILGYYQIMFREIELEDFPEEISEYNPCVNDGKIPTVYIRYIAINEKFQRKKIGTNTLRIIIKNVKELSNLWPVRVITIDAKIDLIKWYESEGFVKMKSNTYGQNGVTQLMYYDCMNYSKEFEEYLCSVIE